MSESSAFTLPTALALVFGTPPFVSEYTTDHIRRVLGKLLGQDLSEEQMLDALREAPYATPRPGAGKHLLKWRFCRAEEPGLLGRAAASPRPPGKRRGGSRSEPSIARTMNLKR